MIHNCNYQVYDNAVQCICSSVRENETKRRLLHRNELLPGHDQCIVVCPHVRARGHVWQWANYEAQRPIPHADKRRQPLCSPRTTCVRTLAKGMQIISAINARVYGCNYRTLVFVVLLRMTKQQTCRRCNRTIYDVVAQFVSHFVMRQNRMKLRRAVWRSQLETTDRLTYSSLPTTIDRLYWPTICSKFHPNRICLATWHFIFHRTAGDVSESTRALAVPLTTGFQYVLRQQLSCPDFQILWVAVRDNNRHPRVIKPSHCIARGYRNCRNGAVTMWMSKRLLKMFYF